MNSPGRDLRILTGAEGGVEHCQGDLFASGIDVMTDWVADVFRRPAPAKTRFTMKPD